MTTVARTARRSASSDHTGSQAGRGEDVAPPAVAATVGGATGGLVTGGV
jgi:hypothetical protein